MTLPEASVTALGPSYAQTLLATFYPDLTRLGIRVEGTDFYRYNGADTAAARVVVDDLYRENEGFCEVRGGTLRAERRPYTIVLAADGARAVRGVVYDASRAPQLTYVYFTGRSLRTLPVRRCR